MSKPVADIFYAVQSGDFASVKALTQKSDSWKRTYHAKSGDTPLLLAARHGHLEILKYCLEQSDGSLSQTNFDGKNALHEAAQNGHVECAKYLLKNGIEVDSLKKADWTPLMLACTKGNLNLIKVLVLNGARCSLTNKDGWNAFHIACREGHSQIVTYIHSSDNQSWKTVSRNGRTPLHTAAMHGHLEVTEFLLKNCSYVIDCQDSCGTTPLMDALRFGHVQVAQSLLQHGADVHMTDNVGHTCLDRAAQAGCKQSVEFLCRMCHMNVNAPTATSQATALHVAAKENQYEMIEQLISYGAKVNATDQKGRTALHIASGSQHVESVQALLKHDASDVPDHGGKFARDFAIKQKIKELLDKL